MKSRNDRRPYRLGVIPGLEVLALVTALFAMWYWEPIGLSGWYFFEQDLPVACAMILAVLAWPHLKLGGWWENEVRLPPRSMLAGVALLIAVGIAGHWLVMFGYDLSRDQAMATFGAEQIARGMLVTPVPQDWQLFGRAMMPLYFHFPIRPEFAWASGYLPINSAFLALGDAVAHRSIANPTLFVVGLFALWHVARYVWPDRRDVRIVVVLLAATSAQLLANAMTSYAMVGHFALNMIWLALFLRNDLPGAIGALVVAFLAMGLHQFHFHPMFAAPFLLWLAWRRQWLLTLVYGLGYLAILYFWTRAFPAWLLDQASGTAAVVASKVITKAAASGRELDFGAYVAVRAGRLFDYSPKIWFFSVVRFFTWHNLATIPLIATALPVLWSKGEKRDGLFLSLLGACAIGLAFPVFQGHGFGYRYLSGVIGCFCLLAGYGWVRLVPQPGPGRPWAMLKAACCFTLIITLPLQLAMARHMVAPYARLHKAVQEADTDVVLVDTEGGFLAQDLVQNGPDFDQRPKTMDLSLVPAVALDHLCRTKKVMRLDRRHYRAVSMREAGIAPQVHDRLGEQRAILDRLGCAPPLPLKT